MNAPSFQFHDKLYTLCRQPRDRELPEAEQATRPWYLRYRRPDNLVYAWKRIGSATERPADLIARAKAFLKGLEEHRSGIDRYLDGVADRRATTINQIAVQYQAAGCPDRNGNPRTGSRLDEQTKHLSGALQFFGPLSPRAVGPADCLEYRTWKRGHLAYQADGSVHAGARTCELDLSALANCLQWAVLTRRLDVNPLSSRPALRDSDAIEHHHRYQPESDEELHKLAGWCFASEQWETRVCGAQILFHAMTGLRSGESSCLEWPELNRPYNAPGMRQVCRPDGVEVEWLHVRREKRGINPVVRVHPALRQFLAAWKAHATQHLSSTYMFAQASGDPSPSDFTRTLNQAAEAIGSPKNRFGESRRTAHALRGYYVSVRRDAGVADIMIAAELGQGGGDRLIRSTYGAPDAFASGRLDWMPTTEPAWAILSRPSNVVPLQANS